MATFTQIFIDQGSDFSAIVTLNNQDGTPINLTNATVASQFRKSYTSSTATNFVVSIYNAVQGKIRMQLPAATSSAIAAGRYLYDVEVVFPTTEKKRALEGIVVINPEITR